MANLSAIWVSGHVISLGSAVSFELRRVDSVSRLSQSPRDRTSIKTHQIFLSAVQRMISSGVSPSDAGPVALGRSEGAIFLPNCWHLLEKFNLPLNRLRFLSSLHANVHLFLPRMSSWFSFSSFVFTSHHRIRTPERLSI